MEMLCIGPVGVVSSLITGGAILYWSCWHKRRGLPPGPMPWPLIGNLWSICRSFPDPDFIGAWRAYHDWYGPMFTVWYGETPLVMIADSQLIQETIKAESRDNTGRLFFMDHYNMFEAARSAPGISRSEGKHWQNARRTTLQLLRNAGMGRPKMENVILEELGSFFEKIRDTDTSSFDSQPGQISTMIEHFNGYVAHRLMLGPVLDNQQCIDLTTEISDAAHVLFTSFMELGPMIVNCFPWLRHLPYFSRLSKNVEKNVYEKTAAIYGHLIEVRMRQLRDEKQTSTGCFMDSFLTQVLESSTDGGPDNPIFTLANYILHSQLHFGCFSTDELRGLVLDLHLTLVSTTNKFLQSFVALMMFNLDAQETLQAELDSYAQGLPVGVDGFPQLDKSCYEKCPYLNATINEAFRRANVIITPLARRTPNRREILGYSLPASTVISSLFTFAHCDEKYFAESERFRPERFLDAEGKYLSGKHVNPFGIGRRSCVGEVHSRQMAFLFGANFFLRFKVTPVHDQQTPPERVFSTVTQPKPFPVCITKRAPPTKSIY